MQTLNELRATLGIGSLNQIRNRIDAIREPLRPHMKRGPNNQILIEDEGIRLLQMLQELHDTGLTIREASKIIEVKAQEEHNTWRITSERLVRNRMKPGDPAQPGQASRSRESRSQSLPDHAVEWASQIEAIRFEVKTLKERVSRLEGLLGSQHAANKAGRWWESVEEG